jgi:hypothetical protein
MLKASQEQEGYRNPLLIAILKGMDASARPEFILAHPGPWMLLREEHITAFLKQFITPSICPLIFPIVTSRTDHGYSDSGFSSDATLLVRNVMITRNEGSASGDQPCATARHPAR